MKQRIGGGLMKQAKPFERIYALQWLQSYGFNGLNAGGHGSGMLEGVNCVMMGHTTVREPEGLIRLPNRFGGSKRSSRGEAIGDCIDPETSEYYYFGHYESGGSASPFATQRTNGQSYNMVIQKKNSRTALNFGRRLPVRAWGVRTASELNDMLAGDPPRIKRR